MNAGTNRADWRALWASGDLARFMFICLGILLHATNETMVATVMPAMVGELFRRGAGGLVAGDLRDRRHRGGCGSRPACHLCAAAQQHGGGGAALCRRRGRLRHGPHHAPVPRRPADRGAGRRSAGGAGLRLGGAAFPAQHLAAAIRGHVGHLGRGGVQRTAGGRADHAAGLLAVGLRRLLLRSAAAWRWRALRCCAAPPPPGARPISGGAAALPVRGARRAGRQRRDDCAGRRAHRDAALDPSAGNGHRRACACSSCSMPASPCRGCFPAGRSTGAPRSATA